MGLESKKSPGAAPSHCSRHNASTKLHVPAKNRALAPKEKEATWFSFILLIQPFPDTLPLVPEPSKMDLSEEVRAAHKREFADFLDQDVCRMHSLCSFLCVLLCRRSNDFCRIIRWGKAFTWTKSKP